MYNYESSICRAKPMEIDMILSGEEKSILLIVTVIFSEKSIPLKECSLSGSNCGSMILRVNKCIERTCKN